MTDNDDVVINTNESLLSSTARHLLRLAPRLAPSPRQLPGPNSVAALPQVAAGFPGGAAVSGRRQRPHGPRRLEPHLTATVPHVLAGLHQSPGAHCRLPRRCEVVVLAPGTPRRRTHTLAPLM